MSAEREVLARRARLQQRAAIERAELEALVREWERPLRAVDGAWSLARRIHRSPWLRVAAGVAVGTLAILRPRRLGDWTAAARTILRLIPGA